MILSHPSPFFLLSTPRARRASSSFRLEHARELESVVPLFCPSTVRVACWMSDASTLESALRLECPEPSALWHRKEKYADEGNYFTVMPELPSPQRVRCIAVVLHFFLAPMLLSIPAMSRFCSSLTCVKP